MDDKILSTIKDTSLYNRLKQIRNIYNKLEKKQKEFCNSFCITCANNCGKCCENFTPDITQTEAEFLAYGLIKEDIADLVLDLMNSKGENDHYCPLYLKNSNYHCSVYKWRPMICRLFGASASKDKQGNPVFKKCKWNTDGKDISKEEFEQHKKAVLIMSDFGQELEAIETSNDKRELVQIALPRAIDEIRYIIELENNNKKD